MPLQLEPARSLPESNFGGLRNNNLEYRTVSKKMAGDLATSFSAGRLTLRTLLGNTGNKQSQT